MRPCLGVGHLLLRWLRVCSRRARNRLPKCVRERWAYAQLLWRSLFYNSLTNCDVVSDSLLEPIFWMVDILTRWFGMVFVFLVVALTSSILIISYFCLLPLVLNTYPPFWIVWHICYGHWNLIMIIFHYYKATKTSPGYPPKMKPDIPFVSVCKKCIIPKPARTHHCGICNTCILKMDHHCPWLNNCVGHFNHRYFFSFCLFMTLGCMYCSISGRTLFINAYHAIEHFKHLEVEQPGVPVKGVGLLIGIVPPEAMTKKSSYNTPPPPYTFKDKMFHKSIIYMWVLTSTVAVALGGLTLWHAMLISRGETSIERHINKKEAKRLAKHGKVYRNPFNYGRLNNWKIFFGVEKTSHWLTRVLLPSSHAPYGDGLTWDIYPHQKDIMPV
ncbi:palmitoyltransferase ZDHHC16A-like isoform X1 [Denticeps clupeoides]|uniref:Palmitoyltransferase n=1 Tax=Denticeps clupeoides TaxID=299321 RepID=A0A8C4C7M6_9TELE|nr:palmitoyltransferase ZDHHC16A-like isoform X1 [Denticeps clupeoides]XP_028824785.1 palmitoyltransferase ZDHHC16A-like isoform X1 [Denticeps clupeoides]XP_028824787.1 palmitoyltransferase ZDHHC16A-like isoform X1 [Denticeps clupeoides]XP_028826554.1 palmitoyltransferase ZDHHC16A-like isoform X1 [Denticeps clupeoides]